MSGLVCQKSWRMVCEVYPNKKAFTWTNRYNGREGERAGLANQGYGTHPRHQVLGRLSTISSDFLMNKANDMVDDSTVRQICSRANLLSKNVNNVHQREDLTEVPNIACLLVFTARWGWTRGVGNLVMTCGRSPSWRKRLILESRKTEI